MRSARYIFLVFLCTIGGAYTVHLRSERLKLGYEVGRLQARRMDLIQRLRGARSRLSQMCAPRRIAAQVAKLKLDLAPSGQQPAAYSHASPSRLVRPEDELPAASPRQELEGHTAGLTTTERRRP